MITHTILGAGLAGLTAGYRLSQREKVFLIEKNDQVGGLARTIMEGQFRFDLGGHRFFTDQDQILNFIQKELAIPLLKNRRLSRIFLQNQFFSYPVQPLEALKHFGLKKSLRISSDYLYQRIHSNPTQDSFEDWVIAQYGRALYQIYFQPYTEKILGLNCRELSRQWAEERISSLSLGQVIKNSLSAKNSARTLNPFYYYPRLGIGEIAEKLAQGIRKNQSQILTRAPVQKISHQHGRVTEIMVKNNPTPIKSTSYISTIPLNQLICLLDPPPPPAILQTANSLIFRDLIIVFLTIQKKNLFPDSWLYYPEKKIIFGRLHEPKVWSHRMSPLDQTSIVSEIFCRRADAIWSQTDQAISNQVIQNYGSIPGLSSPRQIISGNVVRVPDAYPVYFLNYQKPLSVLKDYLSQFNNLHLLGRSGSYKYNNMDHSIAEGLSLAHKIISS